MLKKVEAYIRLEKLTEVRSALVEIGVPAIDTVEVQGHGRQPGIRMAGRHSSYTVDTLPRLRLTVVVSEDDVAQIVETIRERAATGTQGDGAIYVCPVDNIVRVSTGEQGADVLVYEGDIDIQGMLSPPPDLSDFFAFFLERKYRIED
ncbi:MAG: P-II family nitrogen regulator [Caldilineaceae bacterium SB0675_bin_29]|uniref:P-II family nitrogen regulator n=1 Tax=Caldilineaceae bacterium SB0675_bin_29 TaxID=2605266 RepID=A0A6B1G3Y4_9CHLR|nr:P-II family nitrogen regulator [Caldilineaceae bacterium SB0675_bin_29]